MEKELTKTKWGIDHAHSEIGFRIKHLMVTNVRGTFKEFDFPIPMNTVLNPYPESKLNYKNI
jgi:polyisoprenoid-binding protein YceI